MAFPTIPTGGRVVTGVQTGTSQTRTFPSLTGLTKNSGDLLIAIVVAYQSSATANTVWSGWGGGFTELPTGGDLSGPTAMAIGVAYKWSTGSETGTFTVTEANTVTGDCVFFLLSIPGAHSTTPPEAGGFAILSAGSISPSWGAADTLWIVVEGSGESATSGTFTGVTGAPANYSDFVATAISQDAIGGLNAGVAFRQLNAASEDPGGFTHDTTSTRQNDILIAVRPAINIAITDTGMSFGESLVRKPTRPITDTGVTASDSLVKSGSGTSYPRTLTDWGVSTYVSQVLVDNPLAYYRMNDADPSAIIRDYFIASHLTVNGTAFVPSASLIPTDAQTHSIKAGDSTSRASVNHIAGIDPTVGHKTTVEFLYYWDGLSGGVLWSFTNVGTLDLWNEGSNLGYNTANGDIFGFHGVEDFKNRLNHVVCVIYSGDYTQNKIYVNGLPRVLSQIIGTPPTTAEMQTDDTFTIMNLGGGGYGTTSPVSDIAVYDGELSQARITAHYNALTKADTIVSKPYKRFLSDRGFGANLITGNDGDFEDGSYDPWDLWLDEHRAATLPYGAHTGDLALNFESDPGVSYTGLFSGFSGVSGTAYQAEFWFTTPVAGNYQGFVTDGGTNWSASAPIIAVAANTPTRLYTDVFVPTNSDEWVFRVSNNSGNFAGEVVAYDDVVVWKSDSLASSYAKGRSITDTGFTFSETLNKIARKVISDTGMSFSESLVTRCNRPLTDTGNTFSETFRSLRNRPLTDTGFTFSEILLKVARKTITDTGVTPSDILVSLRNRPVTDTGVTPSDSLVKLARLTRAITDTGLSPSDVLAERISHALTDTGVTSSDTLVSLRRHVLSDTGVNSLLAIEVLADTPRGYYKLNEGAGTGIFDASGNGLNGAYINTPLLTDPGLLRGETSAYFQNGAGGSGQKGEIADNSLLDLGDVWTQEAWIKRASINWNDGIITKGNGAYGMHLLGDDLLWAERSGFNTLASSSVTITDTTGWHHCVVTKNGATTKVYIDGADVTVFSTADTCADNALSLYIGARPNGLVGFHGWIAHAAVYPTALSPTRVLAHYNAVATLSNDSLVSTPRRVRSLTDTGVTPSDTLVTKRNRVLSDTGITAPSAAFVSSSYLPALLDDFNRADGALTSPWTDPDWANPLFVISSNQIAPNSTHDYHDQYYLHPSGPFSTLAEVVTFTSAGVGTSVGNNNIGLCAWAVGGTSGAGYHIDVAEAQIQIWRRDMMDAWTLLANPAVTFTVGDLVGAYFEVVSGQVVITLYSKTGAGSWTQQATYTDTTPALSIGPWQPGISGAGDSASNPALMDDFRASNGTETVSDSLVAVKTPGAGVYPRTATDTGVSQTDSLVSLRNHLLTDTGFTFIESLATLRNHLKTDTGVTPSDSLATVRNHVLTDTGVSPGESLVRLAARFRLITDTGVSFSDVLAERINHYLTDTGVTQSDSLVKTQWLHFTLTDTGATHTESLVTLRNHLKTDTGVTPSDSLVKNQWLHFTLSDTGVTSSDTLATLRNHLFSDTGVTPSDTLATVRNHVLTDTAVTPSDSLVKLARITRALTDTGVTPSDSLLTLRQHVITDTGVTSSDSLVRLAVHFRTLTDTGLSHTDVLAERIAHSQADTGVTQSDTLVKFASKTLTDTLTQTDFIVSLRLHTLTDTGETQTDSLVKTQWLHFTITDTGVTSSDTLTSLRNRALNDNGAITTDSLTKYVSKFISDTVIAQTDELVKGRSLSISDTGVTQSDSLVATRQLHFTISDTGITQTDSLVSLRNRLKTDTGVTPSDSLVRSIVYVRVLSDTGVSFTDVLAERIYHYVTDTGVTSSDSLSRYLAATRSISDTGLTQTDSLVTYKSRSISLTDTGVAPGDTLVTLRQYFRTNTDTGITQTDSLAKLAVLTRSATDTGVTSSDSLATSRTHVLTDTLTQSDSILTRRNHVLTDTGLTQTDVLNVSSGLNINISDNGVTQSDTLVATRQFHFTNTDTGVSQTDTLTSLRNHVLTDTGITSSDSLRTARTHVLTDTGVLFTDVLAERIYHYAADTGCTQTDSLARYLAATRSLTDTGLTSTDSLVTYATRVRTNTDTGLTQTDSLRSRRERILSDIGITQTDSLNASSGLNISVSDTSITQTDSLVATRWFHFTLSDTGLTQTDSLTTLRVRTRTLTDTALTPSDSLTTQRTHFLSDTGVTLVDVLDRRIYHNITTTGVTQSDSLVADYTSGSASYDITLTDTGVTPSDSLAQQYNAVRSTTTSLTFSDTLVARRAFFRTNTDTGLTLTETLGERVTLPLSDIGVAQSDTLLAHREYYRFITDTGLTQSDHIPPITIIRTNLVAGEMYRRYAVPRGVYRTYYVREWWRRWKS